MRLRLMIAAAVIVLGPEVPPAAAGWSLAASYPGQVDG
jgi:hypothetical protein